MNDVNKSKESLNTFQTICEDMIRESTADEMKVVELRDRIKFLKTRVRRFMILSNYNWVLWCIQQAKRPEIDFEYIRYG
jgi:hypothetical protein